MAKVDERSVFINCPFDHSYEKLFLALVASLIALSRTPRSGIEIPDDGQGRLTRLYNLIAECRFSIHDLSSVRTPARFNMPFELGLACAAAQMNPMTHGFFLLERLEHRLDKTLSDLKGRDPIIHRGGHIQLINGVLSEFAVKGREVDPRVVHRIARDLFSLVDRRKVQIRQRSIYNRLMFDYAVTAATELAVKAGLLRP